MKTPEKELCGHLIVLWGIAHKCSRPKEHIGPHADLKKNIWWSG